MQGVGPEQRKNTFNCSKPGLNHSDFDSLMTETCGSGRAIAKTESKLKQKRCSWFESLVKSVNATVELETSMGSTVLKSSGNNCALFFLVSKTSNSGSLTASDKKDLVLNGICAVKSAVWEESITVQCI